MNLFEEIQRRVIVADGAMGTMLLARGIPQEHPYVYANLTHPEVVEDIHRAYVNSGAELIETNTYGANPLRLAGANLAERAREINREGARIARRAARGDAIVAGAVGPVGRPLKPVGRIDPEDARESFTVQIAGLLEGGIDLLLLETFADLNELRIAVEVARAACDLPIIAHKTFIEDGETLAGGLPRRIAAELNDWPIDLIGANCTVGPQRMLDIIASMAEAVVPLSSFPTAGMPQLIGDALSYAATPDYFAEYGRRLAEAGARVIGGCCGTTPDHIRALAAAVEPLRATSVAVHVPAIPVGEELAPPVLAEVEVLEASSELARSLARGEYVVTVELDIPRGLDMTKLLNAARDLKAGGVNAINITDGARARLRMPPGILCHLIQEHVGVEAIMHFCCRDRNLLAIQADLMGGYVLGIRNVIALTGDPAQIGDYPDSTSVFDVDAIGLVHIISRFKQGLDLAGNALEAQANFFVGVAFNPMAENYARELDRLRQKVDNGAQVIFTQPIYDARRVEEFMEDVERLGTRAKNGPGMPLLVGILPLRSARHAEFLHNEVPGIVIPDEVRHRMAECSKEDAPRVGLEMAQDFLVRVHGLTQGAYLLPPFGKHTLALDLIEVLGPRL